MSRSAFRSVVCCLLAILFPAQVLLAGETPSAMLYTSGAAWLNGSEVPKSVAMFSGDLLQTQPDSTANIQIERIERNGAGRLFGEIRGPGSRN
jgi:hypothetical protein